MNVKTIFTTNTQNIVQKTVFLRDTTVANGVLVDENIYKVLAEYSAIIQKLLLEFSLGNFEYVSNILTNNYYNFLSIKLSQIIFMNYPIYEQLRNSIKYSLEGLYKANEQYKLLIITQKNLKFMTEKASILDDIEKLKEYCDSLKQNMSLFPDMNINIVSARIKPEYSEYIKLYGYPVSGVFDMDKLGNILIRLNII